MNKLAAITLGKDGDLVIFTKAKDGADDSEFSRFIYEIYGRMAGLAEELIMAGGTLPEGEYQVPDMNGYEEMAHQYLNYFFEG